MLGVDCGLDCGLDVGGLVTLGKLTCYDQHFCSGGLDREGGGAARPKPGMGAFRRCLNILRIVVATPDDDEVLDATGDKQFTVEQATKVARAQRY